MTGSLVICECFARDGLQHETVQVATGDKVALIDAMTEAGFPRIEATSYSHPKRVPGFSDASEVLAGIKRREGVHYKATCPNPKAVERALADLEQGHGATELSFLASATESHSQRNLRATREEQWARVEEMARLADGKFRLVGVISVALGCPFEGPVDPGRVVEDVARFAALGSELVTVGDTVGTGTPTAVRALWERFAREVPEATCVAHFHDTRGTGIANCLAALEGGATHFYSAFGGVGGHPSEIQYGTGRTGNVATEDLA
ncbi:MAG: hydroxymethylglutaryl-CoA lyase, partial [Roseovarius indicus]